MCICMQILTQTNNRMVDLIKNIIQDAKSYQRIKKERKISVGNSTQSLETKNYSQTE